jgi:hypothetical protein
MQDPAVGDCNQSAMEDGALAEGRSRAQTQQNRAREQENERREGQASEEVRSRRGIFRFARRAWPFA